MTTAGQYANQVTQSESFRNLDYANQLKVRENLLQIVKKYDPNYRSGNQELQQHYDRHFMNRIPESLLRIQEAGPQNYEEQEALIYARKAAALVTTGKSGLDFADGWISGVARSQTLMGGITRVAGTGVLFAVHTAEDLMDAVRGEGQFSDAFALRENFDDSRVTKLYKNNPLMQDAMLYADTLRKQYGGEGMADYDFGNWLVRGLAITGDMAGMAAMYGSVGAHGALTKWVPKVANKIATSPTLNNLTRWGLQAATETVGFVVEDLALDAMSGAFMDDDGWDNWIKQLPGDFARGGAYFVAGEVIGTGLGVIARGAAKGITGLSSAQSMIKFQKMTNKDAMLNLRNLVADNDPMAREALRSTVAEFGGEDAVKQFDRTLSRMEAFRKIQVLGDNWAKIVTDDLEATKFILRSDLGVEFDGNVIKKIGGQNVDIKFKDLADLQSKIEELGAKMVDRNLDQGAKIFGDRSGKLSISATVKGKPRNVRLSLDNLTKTFSTADGSVNIGRAQSYVDSMVKEGESIRVVKVAAKDFDGAKAVKGVVTVPDRVKSPGELRAFSKSLGEQLEFNGIKPVSGKFESTAYLSDLRLERQWTADEIKQLAPDGKLAKSGNSFVFRPTGGQPVKGSLDDIGDYVYRNSLELEDINERLVRDFGYKIKAGKKSAVTLINPDGKETKYANLEDLWKSNSELMPKKPSDIAPLFTKNGEIQAATRTIAQGDADTIIRKAQKFEDNWHNKQRNNKVVSRTTSNGNQIRMIPGEMYFNVRLGDSGLTKTFDNLEDAKKFMRKDMTKFINIQEEFLDRFGLMVNANTTGRYIVWGDGDLPKVFKSLDDVKAYSADLQKGLDTQNSISGLNDVEELAKMRQAELDFKEIEPELKTMNPKAQARVRAGIGVRNFLNNHWNSIHKGIERHNIPELSKLYQEVYSMDKLFRAKSDQFKSLVRQRLKGFSAKERLLMGQILIEEADQSQWRAIARNKNIDLKEDMLSAMQDTRSLMDDLGVRFGIKPEDWISNYYPRILSLNLAEIRSGEALDPLYLKKMLDPTNKMPELTAFFENARIADLQAMKMNMDIESVINTYATVGFRKQYLADPLKRFDDVVVQSVKDGQMSYGFRKRLQVFERSVAGNFVNDNAATRYLEKMGANVERARAYGWGKDVDITELSEAQVKMIERTLNMDVARGLSTAQTSALMSFKVWMPLRNVAQVNHVGAIYTNPAVIRAIRKITDDPERYYRMAMAKGFLGVRKPPDMKHFLSWLEGVNTYGTAWFRNSDDYTRIVAMVAAQDAFGDGLGLLMKGDIDVERFLKRTHAQALDTGTRQQFMSLIGKGKTTEASQLLERNIIDWTMFNYSASQKTSFAHTVVGKSMLSYSTYPIQFAEMFGRILKYDKLAGIRLVGNLAMLSYFYNDVAGLEGYEGNPLKIMTFAGGPLMSGGLDALGVIQQGSYALSQADDIQEQANRLLGMGEKIGRSTGRLLLPFNWYPKRFGQGLSAIDDGEYYTSLLNFAGLNVNSEAIIPNVDLDDIVDGLEELGF
jgi:hypothetical protein